MLFSSSEILLRFSLRSEIFSLEAKYCRMLLAFLNIFFIYIFIGLFRDSRIWDLTVGLVLENVIMMILLDSRWDADPWRGSHWPLQPHPGAGGGCPQMGGPDPAQLWGMVAQEVLLRKQETKMDAQTNFQQAVLCETKRNKAKIVHSNKKAQYCNK